MDEKLKALLHAILLMQKQHCQRFNNELHTEGSCTICDVVHSAKKLGLKPEAAQ